METCIFCSFLHRNHLRHIYILVFFLFFLLGLWVSAQSRPSLFFPFLPQLFVLLTKPSCKKSGGQWARYFVMWVIFAFCSHNSTGGVGNGLMAFFSPGWCSEWVAGGFFLVAGFFVCAVADCSLFSLLSTGTDI